MLVVQSACTCSFVLRIGGADDLSDNYNLMDSP